MLSREAGKERKEGERVKTEKKKEGERERGERKVSLIRQKTCVMQRSPPLYL